MMDGSRSSISTSSLFSESHSRIPDDTVFFEIYPDSSDSFSLQFLHLQILDFLSPFTSSYIWQHAPPSLSLSLSSSPPHLHGSLRFGDNIEDEWFLVFLLFHLSTRFPSLSIRVHDIDGEFLLIEAAFHLPRWINPETSTNRVFIRRGHLHIIPKRRLPNPSLTDSLKFFHENESRASEAVEEAVKRRISEYPERARRNIHQVRVRVPPAVAQVLKYEPCFISLAVEGFYDRDIDTMKFAAKMERLLKGGREEELVCLTVKMSRAMYAQLMQQKFLPPKCYPMPSRRDDVGAYFEAELGMKIACGLEMMYQQRKREGEEGKGSTWNRYNDALERSGYFQGLLPGSAEYKRLMENAESYYRKSSLFSRTSEMLNAPVRRIDEILALPYSADEFRNQEVPPSDDDSWMYDGEDELNSTLQERQKEMDIYNTKHKSKQKLEEQQDDGPLSSSRFDLQEIAKSMRGFVEKISSYKGAEVPEDRNLKEVDIDVERFLKDMESVMEHHQSEDKSGGVDSDEASSLDMDFDESEDGIDIEDHLEKSAAGEVSFMETYGDALNEELKNTTLKKSFIQGNEHSTKSSEGKSDVTEVMDEDFTPVNVDFNLVKNLLDSFASQKGEPGPTSNLLGLMGLQLPQDSKKGK